MIRIIQAIIIIFTLSNCTALIATADINTSAINCNEDDLIVYATGGMIDFMWLYAGYLEEDRRVFVPLSIGVSAILTAKLIQCLRD